MALATGFTSETMGIALSPYLGVELRNDSRRMRMLGPSGNPQARNLFEIVRYLQHKEKVRFKVLAAAAT